MTKFNRRPDDRPAEILDAALKCFVANGYASTKVEDLAAAAGVTVGTVYRYFPAKDTLIGALVERHLDLSWARGREIADAYGALPARQIVELLLYRWAETLEREPVSSVLMVMIREAPQFPDAAKKYTLQLQGGFLALERALRHGIDLGEFPLLDVTATARSLAATVVEGTVLELSFGKFLNKSATAEHSQVKQAIQLVVRGLPRANERPLDRQVPPPPPANPADVSEAIAGSGLRVVTLSPPARKQ